MNNQSRHLEIKHLSEKLKQFEPMITMVAPTSGWIKAVRSAIGMSMRQLGERMSITPQGVKRLEDSEAGGNISINTLRELGNALDLQLVYGFVPREGGLEKMIEQQAQTVATQIVKRTHQSMILEDQQINDKQLKQHIKQKAATLQETLPRYLWD